MRYRLEFPGGIFESMDFAEIVRHEKFAIGTAFEKAPVGLGGWMAC